MLYELHSVPEVHPGAVTPLMIVSRLWIADNCHFGSLCQVRKLTDMDERAMYLSKKPYSPQKANHWNSALHQFEFGG